ncbi:Drug transporter [Mycena indigotica]|uniref:Drug transporter n=1 Tax=Mycena indigotica TaxID=2126181 RepID=A0A8H6T015_9AGAR|nr:Drug transporter [Mycena indigotica]KAF7309455.1 Drug transporter [Mycena indigotica]
MAFPEDGLLLKTLEQVNEPSLDPRVSLETRKDVDDTATLTRQLSNLARGKEVAVVVESGSCAEKSSEPLYVEFQVGDRRNPMCFPPSKKWAITILACYSTFIAASTSSAYNLGLPSMISDLNCTEFQAIVGLAVFTLGFGVVPLVSSSFSEEFGRQPLYIVSAVGFTLMYLVIALAHNIRTVIAARFLQGAFGSTWATMCQVGGTIADIWTPQERGLPMSIFSVAALGGTGLGPVISGWIEMNPKLQWRWIEWIQMINCGVYSLFVPLILTETRTSILLTRLAKKLRKETGDSRYRARIEDERANLMVLIFISCTRPIHLLFTEPVVSSFSLWIGFLWGVMFCMIESIPGVFRDLHHFNVGEEGTVFTAIMQVSCLSLLTEMFNFKVLVHCLVSRQIFTKRICITLQSKYVKTRGPEARLISACAAAVGLPISMFVYAWCSYARIHWISLVMALTIYFWATFVVYLAVFSYLADCYGPFASSALAGQSLCRKTSHPHRNERFNDELTGNLMGTAFPLFTKQMFARLGYNWANTMFALIASLMMPIPFILLHYGPRIRAKSRFSRVVLEREISAEFKPEIVTEAR